MKNRTEKFVSSRACKESTKKKLRALSLGKKLSEETKIKIKNTMLSKNLKSPRETRACLNCGSLTSNRKFCQRSCYNSYRAKKIEQVQLCECGCGSYANPGKKYIYGHNRKNKLYVQKEVRVCPMCGTEFECRVTSTRKYCTTVCQLEYVHTKEKKPVSKETKEKISDAISQVYLNGFRPKSSYDDGWVKTRLGEDVYCRSSYEKQAVNLLNSYESVLTIKAEALRISYTIEGVRRFYIPDFLVSTIEDDLYLIEVKPKSQVDEKENQIKFAAAREYAKKHNMIFLIWTEDVLFNKNGSTTTSLQEIVKATAAIPLMDDDIV